MTARGTDYDPFALAYNRHWSSFAPRILPVLQRLGLGDLPAGASVLDVCCGSGQLCRALTDLGYRATGIDASQEMLRFARDNAPDAEFVHADVREFRAGQQFDAAVSTFDSLNHMLTLDDLARALRNVGEALIDGGPFIFDLNMDEAYRTNWHGSTAFVDADLVCVGRAGYDEDEGLGHIDFTLFHLIDGSWRRSDFALKQRAYPASDVCAGLEAAGFGDIRTYDGQTDLGMERGAGRAFFVAHRMSL